MFKKAKSLGKSLLIASGAIIFSVGIYAVTAEFIGPGLKWSADVDRPLGTAINVLFGLNADQVEITNDCSSSTAEICLDADDDYDMDSSNVVANASGSVIERLEWIIENKVDDKNCQIGTVNGAGTDSDGDQVVYDFDYFLNGTTHTGSYVNLITNGQELYTAGISCTQTVASIVTDSESVAYVCDAGFHESGGICVSNGECQFDGNGDMFLECDLASDVLPVEEVFSTYLYTGNGSTQTIENGIDLENEEGMVWTKARSFDSYHGMVDTVRGTAKAIYPNALIAENTQPSITSFNSDGYTIGTEPYWNQNSDSFVSWTFRQAPKFFDVVTYTGDGTGTKSFSHNLDIAPGMMIVKRTDSTGNWFVYHRSGTATTFSGAETYGYLNMTNMWSDNASIWGNTEPTNLDFTVGLQNNTSGATYVAYLFAHDPSEDGVIQCGDFASTVASQSVNLGWEPQYLLYKRTNSSDNWNIADSMRGWQVDRSAGTVNLQANSSVAESAYGITGPTSTGFTHTNGNSGDSYIYCAIRRPNQVPVSSSEVFKTVEYTGAGAGTTVDAGIVFDTQLVTNRDSTQNWSKALYDRLRSGLNDLIANTAAAEVYGPTYNQDFGKYQTKAYSIGPQSYTSAAGASYISHFFKRAPGFFDVVAYEGNGVAGRTVEHNLGVEPEMMIFKRRNSTSSWSVYHHSYGNANSTNLDANNGYAISASYLNSTSPNSNEFSLGSSVLSNGSGYTYISYLFASLPGISKVGSYTGTAADLDIDAGFTTGPAFVLIKRTDASGDWYFWDSERGIVEGNDPYLLLNSTAAEVTTTDYLDPIEAGFRVTSTAPAALNAAGGEYIYYTIAKPPFVTCGDSVDYAGQDYETVEIGTQCWFAENLNVGAKLAAASTEPTDNSTIEKWCYDNSDANCDTYGGLYNWDEMMGYTTTEGGQGICPTGWHVATDSEWSTLENYYATGTCEEDRNGWDCDPAGTALKDGGASGFDGLLSGVRNTGGSYSFLGEGEYFRSSTESGTIAWLRNLNSSTTTVSRPALGKTYGSSARCLQD